MKFSIASTLLLASSVVAMPWSFANSKHSGHEEITLRIKVSQPSSEHVWSRKRKSGANTNVYCQRGCLSEKPECPEGLIPINFADWDEESCWACCDGSF